LDADEIKRGTAADALFKIQNAVMEKCRS